MSFQQKLRDFFKKSLASWCICQQGREYSLISHIEKKRFGNILIILDSWLLLIRNHFYIEKINDCWYQYKGIDVRGFLNIGPCCSFICFWFPTSQIHSANHFSMPLDWEFSAHHLSCRTSATAVCIWLLKEQIWTIVERLVLNALIFTHSPLHFAEYKMESLGKIIELAVEMQQHTFLNFL